MKISEFDYDLPAKLIAQKPVRPRDSSRLMAVNGANKKIVHSYFYEIETFLKSGDVLVLNDSKVIPARLYGKKPSGGKVEVLLIKKISPGKWEAIIGGVKSKKEENEIIFNRNLKAQTRKFKGGGLWEIEFSEKGNKLEEALYRLGEAPVPPYIKEKSNLKTYQTVYAKNPGSSAAPTAGFHFTPRLIKELKKKGIGFEFVTLHVGPGTFLPVKEDNIKRHKMHSELAAISAPVAKRLNRAKGEGRRIIAVGTTAARTLESFCEKGKLQSGKKETDIFIYPGYKFKFTGGLITNFHLPKSTLLMLVCAFAGKDLIFRAYKQAIAKKYRFYSFGDSMIML